MNRNSGIDDSFLGLDLGSTSTRAFLWCPKRKVKIDVPNMKSVIRTRKKYGEGEFSSAGYPFGPDQRVYFGERGNKNRQEISLKYVFYVLVPEVDHGEDKFFEQYALVSPLRERQHNPAFRQKLRRGLVDLFSAVRIMVQEQCKARGLRVTSIGLSVPSQWTMEFEDVYRDIVAEVFNEVTSPNEQLSFHTETEALAHFLLQHHLEQLLGQEILFAIQRNKIAYKVLLFLDFGGHNMNGCIFNVTYAGSGMASFYSISEAFGAGGGSEHWAYYMGELFERKLGEAPDCESSTETKREWIEWFHEVKDQLGPIQPHELLDLRAELDDAKAKFELCHEEINECFERGMGGVLKEAGTRINALGLKAVERRVNGFCKRNGIDEPTYVWDAKKKRLGEFISGNIATGVAYAASNRLTIDEFVQRGAGFGLQRKQNSTRGKIKSDDSSWENVASPIFSLTSQDPLEFLATANDEFRIICDPFFDIQGVKKTAEMKFDRCYDIIYLGKPKNGVWWFEMFLRTHNGQVVTVLKTRRQWFSGETYEDGRQWRKGPKDLDAPGGDKKTCVILPLYFDGGKNCFLMHESFDVASLNLGPDIKPAKTSKKDLDKVAGANTNEGTRRSARQAEKFEQTATVQANRTNDRIDPIRLQGSPASDPQDCNLMEYRQIPTCGSRFVLREGPPAPEAVMAPTHAPSPMPTSMPTPPLAQCEFDNQDIRRQKVIHQSSKHRRVVSDEASDRTQTVNNPTSKRARSGTGRIRYNGVSDGSEDDDSD
ncbi:hypothetical protein K456DRAFT_1696579 [Colletotrichum gloeosporioides 23]|nr:hypothetical protein K456DRAFT_1696579 [Colletotrichum gloeosporioides 23]